MPRKPDPACVCTYDVDYVCGSSKNSTTIKFPSQRIVEKCNDKDMIRDAKNNIITAMNKDCPVGFKIKKIVPVKSTNPKSCDMKVQSQLRW